MKDPILSNKKFAYLFIKTEIIELPDPARSEMIQIIYHMLADNGFSICRTYERPITYDQARELYPRRKLKHPDWGGLEEYLKRISSGDSRILILKYKNDDAQVALKKLVGADPEKAEPNTIRGELREPMQREYENLETRNGIHAPETAVEAEEELAILLYKNEIDDITTILK